MAEQKANLRKIRDFGENINDALAFIKQNSSSYLRSFFAICAIFMLAQAISTGIFQTRTMGLFGRIFTGGNLNVRYLWNLLGPMYLIIILLSVLTVISMQVALTAYLKQYSELEGKPTLADVWSVFRRYYLEVLACHLLLYIIIFAATFILVAPFGYISIYLAILAFILCMVGAVYLYVNLIPFTVVIMMENKGFTQALKRCFEIVKGYFWMSFAIYFIDYLIYMLGTVIISVGVGLVGTVIGLLTVSKLANVMGIITAFLGIFSLSFYVVYFTCVALNYFSLVERKDGTGLLSRIGNIGNSPAGGREVNEQY